MKYSDEMRSNLLTYLSKRHETDIEIQKEFMTTSMDFVITHHLIKEQIVVHSFLNLNTNTKAIFKFPAQKKKMLAHLKSQISRFETNQKGKRKNSLHPDIKPLVESFLTKNKSSGKYFFLSRKLVKDQDKGIFKLFEKFSSEEDNTYNFPNSSL